MIRITSRGNQYVEGDLVQQAASRVTFNVRNAYDSIFGTLQHTEMNVSFDHGRSRTRPGRGDRAARRTRCGSTQGAHSRGQSPSRRREVGGSGELRAVPGGHTTKGLDMGPYRWHTVSRDRRVAAPARLLSRIHPPSGRGVLGCALPASNARSTARILASRSPSEGSRKR